MSMSPLDWSGWFPGAVTYDGREPQVEWFRPDGTRFTYPFFYHNFRKARGERRNSDWSPIRQLAAEVEAIPPSGFIFHMSRCGSTLLSQMLAASTRNIVLSEPAPVDAVLRARAFDPEMDEAEQRRRLREVVAVLGRRRFDDERRLFIKFDCWSMEQLPLILGAFPEVPWLFLYRDPLEVLLSHKRQPGQQTVPGLIIGPPFERAPAGIDFHDFGPWVLAEVCRAALTHHTLGRGRLVNYRQLPALFDEELVDFFAMDAPSDERRIMAEAAAFRSKAPKEAFNGDRGPERPQPTDELRARVERWLRAPYNALEQARLGYATAPP